MNPNTKKLHDVGQSIWLDNISREMLMDGTLARYIADWSVTGLTSNPTIFEHAISHGNFYDEAMGHFARRGESGEELFFRLALQDLTAAADMFRPVFDATGGVDGWVSLEVSPLLVNDSLRTIHAASRYMRRLIAPTFSSRFRAHRRAFKRLRSRSSMESP